MLHELVEQGNFVLVIEHNVEVIKTADWIIDLGPEGGDGGGEIVAAGPPKDVVKEKCSYAGTFLQPVLATRGRSGAEDGGGGIAAPIALNTDSDRENANGHGSVGRDHPIVVSYLRLFAQQGTTDA